MTRRLTAAAEAVEPLQDAVRCYTVRQAAALLNLGKTKVYELIADGHLRSVQLGDGVSRRRVRADDLQAFIDARTR